MDSPALYHILLEKYGPQGWWPLISFVGSNPTQRGRLTGYHPENFELPHTEQDRLEIMLGAILTQNTSWINAEKALFNLSNHGLINISQILATPIEELANFIRSSGYYNQKAKKIQIFVHYLKDHPISSLLLRSIPDLRSELLTIKGIGEETCDSILLYALSKPIFVVDAYTKRLFIRLGLASQKVDYTTIQSLVHSAISPSVPIFNEFHALIVQHAVKCCLKTPQCESCFVNPRCLKSNIEISVPVKKKPLHPKKTPKSN